MSAAPSQLPIGANSFDKVLRRTLDDNKDWSWVSGSTDLLRPDLHDNRDNVSRFIAAAWNVSSCQTEHLYTAPLFPRTLRFFHPSELQLADRLLPCPCGRKTFQNYSTMQEAQSSMIMTIIKLLSFILLYFQYPGFLACSWISICPLRDSFHFFGNFVNWRINRWIY